MTIFSPILFFLNPLLAEVVLPQGEGVLEAFTAAVTITTIVIFLASRFFGELLVRLGLPALLGDLIGGVVLGVSGLHFLDLGEMGAAQINPTLVNFVHWITGTTNELVTGVFDIGVRIVIEDNAEIGILVLLFTIGLESDLKELLKVGLQAAIVSLLGVTFPFLSGFLGLNLLFGVPTLPALLAGAALSSTSIIITAKVMQEMGVLETKEGQIILGAAIIDDIPSIVILALVLSVVEKGQVELGNVVYLIVNAAIFVVAAVLLNRFFGPVYVATLEKLKNVNAVFIGALLFASTMGLIASAIGLEAILGSFAAGLVMGGTEKREELKEMFKPLVAIFTTIFFVSIGAKIDLSVLNPALAENREGLIIASFLIVVAILGKLVAGFFVVSQEKINRLAIGTGMIPRGEVGLVLAGLGASTGALSPSLNVAIVLMVISTTFVAPPLLRVVFTTPEPEALDC